MTEPVVRAPNSVVGVVGEMIAPQDRGVTSAAGLSRLVSSGPLVEQLVPAAQVPLHDDTLAPLDDDTLAPLHDVVVPLQDSAQPAMTMLSSWDWAQAEAGPDHS